MRPAVGRSPRPALQQVVLPEPLGPSRPTTSPDKTSISTLQRSTACSRCRSADQSLQLDCRLLCRSVINASDRCRRTDLSAARIARMLARVQITMVMAKARPASLISSTHISENRRPEGRHRLAMTSRSRPARAPVAGSSKRSPVFCANHLRHGDFLDLAHVMVYTVSATMAVLTTVRITRNKPICWPRWRSACHQDLIHVVRVYACRCFQRRMLSPQAHIRAGCHAHQYGIDVMVGNRSASTALSKPVRLAIQLRVAASRTSPMDGALSLRNCIPGSLSK